MQGKHPWKQGEQVKDDATPRRSSSYTQYSAKCTKQISWHDHQMLPKVQKMH